MRNASQLRLPSAVVVAVSSLHAVADFLQLRHRLGAGHAGLIVNCQEVLAGTRLFLVAALVLLVFELLFRFLDAVAGFRDARLGSGLGEGWWEEILVENVDDKR